MKPKIFTLEIECLDYNEEVYKDYELADFIKRILKPYIDIRKIECNREYQKEGEEFGV